jgi:hypothetical protein
MLLDAMIFHRHVLPTGATPLTAKLTRIRHAAEPGATVHFYTSEEWAELERLAAQELPRTATAERDPEEQEKPRFSYRELLDAARRQVGERVEPFLDKTEEIPLDRLKQYIAAFCDESDQGRFVALTNRVEVRYPFSWPADVEFVDTPGTNDPIVVRERVTLEHLSRADLVILVVYAGRPGNREDLRFLKEKLLPVGPGKILVVLNKFDLVERDRGSRNLAEYVRELFLQSLAGKDDSVPREFIDLIAQSPIIPVSAIRALLGRAEGKIPEGEFYFDDSCRDHGILTYSEAVRASGIESLEAAIRHHLVEHKAKELLLAPVRKSRAVLEHLRDETALKAERIALDLKNLDKSVSELCLELEMLNAEMAGVNRYAEELAQFFSRTVRDVFAAARRNASKVVRDLEDHIKDSYAPKIDDFGGRICDTFPDEVKDLNTNLGWLARGARGRVEQAFLDQLTLLPARLKEKLKTEIDRFPEHTSFSSLNDQIEDLASTEFSLDPLAVRELAAPAGWKNEPRRAAVRRQLKDSAIEFADAARRKIDALESALREKLVHRIEPILARLARPTESRLADLKKTLADKQGSTKEVADKRSALKRAEAATVQLAERLRKQIIEAASVQRSVEELGQK